MINTQQITALIQLAQRAPMSQAESLWLDALAQQIAQQLQAQQAEKPEENKS